MDYQATLESIYSDLAHLRGCGKRADYIPALANVDGNKFGIALETVTGDQFCIGDAHDAFSIQSIAKVFSLAFALDIVGERLWQRVGMEPSGNPFNSLVQLEYEHGIPRNPLINAGALVVVDYLLDELDVPGEEFLQFIQATGAHEARYNLDVARSEASVGFVNAAMANYLKGHGNIHHEVGEVLQTYFEHCSLEMSCVDLAHAFLFLANGGKVPATGYEVIDPRATKRVNAVMLTCGFYDQAGQFAYRVGLPGKSGVGGGIVAVIPGELAIAVWSPGLNESGNSELGMTVLEEFTTRTGLSVF